MNFSPNGTAARLFLSIVRDARFAPYRKIILSTAATVIFIPMVMTIIERYAGATVCFFGILAVIYLGLFMFLFDVVVSPLVKRKNYIINRLIIACRRQSKNIRRITVVAGLLLALWVLVCKMPPGCIGINLHQVVLSENQLIEEARETIGKINSAAELYKQDNNLLSCYPSELEVLAMDCLHGPYLANIPKDPWGNNYAYSRNPEMGNYTIESVHGTPSGGRIHITYSSADGQLSITSDTR